MRNALAALVGFGLVSIFGTGAAFADTSTYNSYKNINEHGSRVTNIDVDVESKTLTVADSQSIKMEANLGDVNVVNIKFDGTNFTGSGHSSNNRPVDPVVYGSFSKERSVNTTTENVSIDTLETVNFNSHEYVHTVGTDY